MIKRILRGIANFGITDKQKIIRDIADFTIGNKMNGDYYEFGVWKGESFINAYKEYNKRDKEMMFFAFDSFEGLPKDIERDNTGFQLYSSKAYSCSEKDFYKNLSKAGVDLRDVRTTEGYYDKTLTNDLAKTFRTNKAVLIHIDCDLYESTIPVLKFIESVLQNGTVIMFDDWFAYKGNPNAGERLAFEEWLKKCKYVAIPYKVYGSIGNSFIMFEKGSFLF